MPMIHGVDCGDTMPTIPTLGAGIDESRIREFADADALLAWLESPDDESDGME
ncbi:hypothetical protein ACIP5T_03045 [Microbacterium sp. NPDC088619]|uniref:hypothetical protein n=1 Tax=Microbacterium sp. NPDC088619 TaxID=3364196 RepID=UPI003815B602